MQPFPHEDFLLETTTAKHLYHDVAKDLPIIDYHSHLSPELIAENHRFRSITEIWLEGDHYKWRAMRANGVDERFCTGNATDFEKVSRKRGRASRSRNALQPALSLDRDGIEAPLRGEDEAAFQALRRKRSSTSATRNCVRAI